MDHAGDTHVVDVGEFAGSFATRSTRGAGLPTTLYDSKGFTATSSASSI